MTQNAAILNDQRILIIEDDQDIAQLLLLHLRDIYRTVKAIHNGYDGFEAGLKESWDIILLDIRLPDMDGLEICKQLRTNKVLTPILMLTSKSSELDQVLGFEIGADDYVTKPFRLLELSARIKALLRRNSINNLVDKPVEQHVIRCGKLELDINKRKATISGEKIELTVREFKLLTHFAKAPGRVYSRMELLDSVWGISHQGYEHTVNSHINRLRNKMSTVLEGKHCIETVWGIGYKLSEEI